MAERKKMFSEIFKEYAEISTIQGLAYIVKENQTLSGKVYWLLTVLFMLVLASYWTTGMYTDWQANLVLTTISSIGKSVKNIEFPSVTFCSQGKNEMITKSAFLHLFYGYLNSTYGIQVNFSSIEAVKLLNLVSEDSVL